MRTIMRVTVLLVGTLLASLIACHTEHVEGAATCSDPCCGGNAILVDCGETPEISCVESGDPCMAMAFGCKAGVFFEMPQAMLPATCSATDSGGDATMEGSDAPTGLFGETPDAAEDATEESSPDGATEAGLDGATEAALDAPNDGPLFTCGDASCADSSPE
jgi:hypothetical protein